MYRIAKLTIKSKLERKEEQIEAIARLLGVLCKNGQILEEYLVEDYKEFYIATVSITDDDSLDEKYYNEYVKKALENLEVDIKVIADDAFAIDSCHCNEHSFYVLATEYTSASSPVICGDCGKEISLIHIPYINNEKEHQSILDWQENYKAVDYLWMTSLSDRFTKRQIINPDSQLNKFGLEVCKELELKVGKSVYLLLRNPIGGWYEFEKNNQKLVVCPKCQGQLKLIENKVIDKVCDICKFAFINPNEK